MGYKKLTALVIGEVQGVGFRYYAARAADRLGLTGWVGNMPDGSVKVEAVGTQEQIVEFLTALQEGPEMSTVEDVQFHIEDQDDHEYSRFEIKFL